jgi:hypothetical protein
MEEAESLETPEVILLDSVKTRNVSRWLGEKRFYHPNGVFEWLGVKSQLLIFFVNIINDIVHLKTIFDDIKYYFCAHIWIYIVIFNVWRINIVIGVSASPSVF